MAVIIGLFNTLYKGRYNSLLKTYNFTDASVLNHRFVVVTVKSALFDAFVRRIQITRAA